jgi:glycosyltransferase involved in cell wall biosynthesis
VYNKAIRAAFISSGINGGYRLSLLVSITCTAYNQEKYIARTLDSFLMQQTDFDYEVLIHDDASTDYTAAIIREYESRYPHIFKPWYQTENQWSKGIRLHTACNLPRALGKYVAMCDGDDYWTDPFKLQKQVDYMEAHPDCTLCFHAIELVKNNQKPTGRFIKPYDESCIVPIEDIIIGGGGFIGTNSVVFPIKCLQTLPGFYLRAPVADVPLQLFLASQGPVYYMDEVMSAYRQGVEGSWNSHMAKSRKDYLRHLSEMIRMAEEFNVFTEYQYADSVRVRQLKNEFLFHVVEGNMQAIKEEKYRSHYQQLSKYNLAMIYMKRYFPDLYDKLRAYKK